MATKKKMLQAAAGASVGSGGEGWDISTAEFNGTPINYFGVAFEEITPTGLFFKPDGTKMYLVGSNNDNVNEYNLSTAWDITTASYVQSFYVATEEAIPNAVFFKDDGTEMYILGSNGDEVNQYTLSTAWDISTASYTRVYSIAGQETNPNALFFNTIGNRMFIAGSQGNDINQYNLSTAWDISTATYNSVFALSGSGATSPTGLYFKDGGTKLYVANSAQIYEFNLGTAYNITTAVFVRSVINPSGGSIQDIFFKDDGTKMYLLDTTYDKVHQLDLSTEWDTSTLSYSPVETEYFSVAAEDIVPTDISFKSDGTSMYIIGQTNDYVYQYTLSTAWDIDTASFLQSKSVSAYEANPYGLFFKPDGTKMYIIGAAGDEVNQFNLSTAWDISTASYASVFSVVAQEPTPYGLFFKDDGTKMYVVGAQDDIDEYTLSTAWDISTCNYLSTTATVGGNTNPYGLYFRDNGTTLYIVYASKNYVEEYSLSTAWDTTTISYVQNFFIRDHTVNVRNLFFKDDGTKMYLLDATYDAVFSYDL